MNVAFPISLAATAMPFGIASWRAECSRIDNQEIRQCLARQKLRFPLQLLSAPPSRHAPATPPIAGHARRRSRSSSNKFGEAGRRLHSPSRRSFITSRHLARCKTPRAKPSQTPMLRSNARDKPILAAKSPIGLAQIPGFCDGHHTRELAQFTSSAK
jgi:hypothetical protein